MTRRLVVIRPEPGNSDTAARARALGWAVEAMPLFAVAPVAWTPPDPARFDALLLTSANAVRHGGPGLEVMRALPVVAVGDATAAAARAAGFRVVLIGQADAAAVSAQATTLGHKRLLHLAGRDRIDTGVEAITVYASDAVPPPADFSRRVDNAVVLLHSARAARTLAALVADRRRTAIAALSHAVRTAAGTGWRACAVAAEPTDAALLAGAHTLAD